MQYGKRILSVVKAIHGSRVTWYCLGIATPLLVIIVLFAIGVEPPASSEELLVEKWQLLEAEEGRLLHVQVPGSEDRSFMVGIRKEPATGLLEEIGAVKFSGPVGFTPSRGRLVPDEANDANSFPPVCLFLAYREKGNCEAPMGVYGSRDWGLRKVWRDLNVDTRFDQRVDYRNSRIEINIGDLYGPDVWVEAVKKEDVFFTPQGAFKFDVGSGTWREVEVTMGF